MPSGLRVRAVRVGMACKDLAAADRADPGRADRGWAARLSADTEVPKAEAARPRSTRTCGLRHLTRFLPEVGVRFPRSGARAPPFPPLPHRRRPPRRVIFAT